MQKPAECLTFLSGVTAVTWIRFYLNVPSLHDSLNVVIFYFYCDLKLDIITNTKKSLLELKNSLLACVSVLKLNDTKYSTPPNHWCRCVELVQTSYHFALSLHINFSEPTAK